MSTNPLISIVIPVHNSAKYLDKCLSALEKSIYKDFEVIAIDDASDDDSAEICSKRGVKLYKLEKRSGPAFARNCGVEFSNGSIIIFIDSDVLVTPTTLEEIVDKFKDNPEMAALFGSYDADPYEKDFLSQYKNLIHHFVHQQSKSEANTFWAGCGAIKKSIFLELGGFDGEKYPTSSIEDIELGYRIRKAEYKICLDNDIQVKHLKKWSIKNYLSAEIFRRAVPWSRLIIETGNFHSDLNLKISDRISAFIVWFILLITTLLIVGLFINGIKLIFIELSILLFLSILFLVLNYKFYKFLLVNRGFLFLIESIPIHFLYFIYSSSVFALIWLKSKLKL